MRRAQLPGPLDLGQSVQRAGVWPAEEEDMAWWQAWAPRTGVRSGCCGPQEVWDWQMVHSDSSSCGVHWS